MDADQFRYYVLGFILYRYLSERLEQYADRVPMFSPWRIEGQVRLSRTADQPSIPRHRTFGHDRCRPLSTRMAGCVVGAASHLGGSRQLRPTPLGASSHRRSHSQPPPAVCV